MQRSLRVDQVLHAALKKYMSSRGGTTKDPQLRAEHRTRVQAYRHCVAERSLSFSQRSREAAGGVHTGSQEDALVLTSVGAGPVEPRRVA
jgi:hypothetical protein